MSGAEVQPRGNASDGAAGAAFAKGLSTTAVEDGPKCPSRIPSPELERSEAAPGVRLPDFHRQADRGKHRWLANSIFWFVLALSAAWGYAGYRDWTQVQAVSEILPQSEKALVPSAIEAIPPVPAETAGSVAAPAKVLLPSPMRSPSASPAVPPIPERLPPAGNVPEAVFAAEAFLSGIAPPRIAASEARSDLVASTPVELPMTAKPEVTPAKIETARAPDKSPAASNSVALATAEVRPPVAMADNVVDFQPYRVRSFLANARGDEIGLTNLNPYAGVWYVLDMKIDGHTSKVHLEAAALRGHPEDRPALALYRDGLEVTVPGQPPKQYPLWPAAESPEGESASVHPKELNPAPQPIPAFRDDDKASAPYYPLCDGLVLVRKQRGGSASRLEYATDLLRTTKMGAWFVEAAKPYLIADPELGEEHRETAAKQTPQVETAPPRAADVAQKQKDLYCKSPKLGVKTDAPEEKYYYGKWYQATDSPHVFAGMMKPTAAPTEILSSYPDRVGTIGMHDKSRKEADALVYLVAFDMAHFRFGYSLGADHPKVDWSTRARDIEGEGPDGFGNLAPLCSAGALPPYYLPYVAATFVGGFKREHGAFRFEKFIRGHNASHFGFEEAGVVCSTLQPGLATAAITREGDLDLLLWPENADGLSSRYVWLRQNCVPIIEGIDAQGASIPGRYVNNWRAGEWSGDQNGEVVTLRSGIAIQEYEGRRFLLFTYFTGASPNAMARIFQAYHCRFAMLLDMNTPSYCYFALYRRDGQGQIADAEYLHKDMAGGNGKDGSYKFVQKNDTRDFFYVLNRQ